MTTREWLEWASEHWILCVFLFMILGSVWESFVEGTKKLITAYHSSKPRTRLPVAKTTPIEVKGIRVSEGQVYLVNDPSSGESRIVHASSPEEARWIASYSLKAEFKNLETTEVYEKVLRR